MATAQRIIKNLYRDSVSLMQFSEKVGALEGVRQASAVMATENNISLLVDARLLASTVAPSPNDLLIVVEGTDDESTAQRRWIRPRAMLIARQQWIHVAEIQSVPPQKHRNGPGIYAVR